MNYYLKIESPYEIKDVFDNLFNGLFIDADYSIFGTDCINHATITSSFKSFEGKVYPRIDEFTFKVRICSMDSVVKRPLNLDLTSEIYKNR